MKNYSLNTLTPATIHNAQQTAVVRLHMYVLGQVHNMLADFQAIVESAARQAGVETTITNQNSGTFQTTVVGSWNAFIEDYTRFLAVAMMNAAAIPFGTLAVLHNEWVRPNIQEEATLLNQTPLFKPQLDEIVQAAYQRTYEDGLNLSNRIWQLDQYGRNGINAQVTLALQNGDSAWTLAQNVETFLGHNQNCPRWAKSRLRNLTKADIASGNETGLIRGSDCSGQGVAYNALRMARTEIHAVHHMATRTIYSVSPWIEAEKINLSPAHAGKDECDDIAGGGENSDGVYPIGEIAMPIHPHCLCFLTSINMDQPIYKNQLQAWYKGQQAWPEMDAYAAFVGSNLTADLRTNEIGITMAYWLWGNHADFGTLFWSIAGGL